MDDQHLDTDKLLAIRRGDTEDPAALEHLASCARCKGAFEDSRWLRLLRRLRGLVQGGSHLDSAEIEAYRHSALSGPRAVEIERHLRACTSCLAAYRRGLDEDTTMDVTPSVDLIDRARKAFRPDNQLWLGTVLLTGLEDGPQAVLLPNRRVASGPSLVSGESPTAFPHSHPSSAKSRANRVGMGDAIYSVRPPIDTLTVSGGGFTIEIESPSELRPDRLEVTLRVQDGRPAANVPLRVRGPAGNQRKGVTDKCGRASIPVDPGRSRIVVEVDPPLAFGLSLLA